MMSLAYTRKTLSSWLELRPIERVRLTSIAIGVVFAALGLGEAVYRLIFLQFEGATDRLPIELLFGILFASLVTLMLLSSYRDTLDARVRVKMIQARNERIRMALAVIAPLPVHQQAIRVIREETEKIDWALAETLPR